MPSTLAPIVAPRLPPVLSRLLEPGQAPTPEHHWEGILSGTRGAAAGRDIRIAASMAFVGGIVMGAGRAVEFPAEGAEATGEFTISGSLEGGSIGLQLWFAWEQIASEPFSLSAELSADGRQMTGEWTFRCFDPAGCGCEGGGGTVRLERVD